VKRRWFKPWGPIYLPVSVEAALLVALAGVFCVQVFLAVDRHSHSASDTLYGIFPYVVPCLIVLYLIAAKTSAAEKK
jgi:hypothetical protein